ncbi:MAG: DNA polymerase III subunit delta [Clostridia bacterium]|nr:DNA polymerase III subunit delta [Clostridia bacterium]
MSVSQLKKDIKNNKFAHSYVFLGAERYLKEYYFALARDTFTGGDELNLNCTVFDAKTMEPEELSAVAESYPVMSERRLIIINDLTHTALTKSVYETLLFLTSDMPDYLTLFFNYSDPEYDPFKVKVKAKKEEGAAKGKKKAKDEEKKSPAEMFSELYRKSLICDFSRPAERDLTVWIKRNVEAGGKTISDAAIRRLITDVSRDMSVLKHEIAKLCAYAPKKEIVPDDIDAVCITTTEARVFSLGDAIIFSRPQAAYTITDTLMRQNREHPLMILAYLTSVFSNLLKLSAAKNARVDLELAKKETGYGGTVSNALRMLSRVDEGTLKRLVTMCRDADFKMKDSRVPPEVIMELFLAEALLLTGARS